MQDKLQTTEKAIEMRCAINFWMGAACGAFGYFLGSVITEAFK